MTNFWEDAFRLKQKMWGDNPTEIATETAKQFKSLNFHKILIPGIGYGRNAKPFVELGFEISGIEISQTAIDFLKKEINQSIMVYKGSVLEMPFDDAYYDGIFCHALIHLLDTNERAQFLKKCYRQLSKNGMMVFTAITKNASTYGVGTLLSKDRYLTKDGIGIFFYDNYSIQREFSEYGLVNITKYHEPSGNDIKTSTEFWKIVCRKM